MEQAFKNKHGVCGMRRTKKQIEADKAALEAKEIAEQPFTNDVEALVNNARVDDMNAYAARIFEGQSPDMPMTWRVERVKVGLIDKGWEAELPELILPKG